MNRIAAWDSHHRLFNAVLVAALAFLLSAGHFRLPVRIVLAWDAFSGAALVMAWTSILFCKPERHLSTAKLQDSSRWIIFLCIVGASVMSLFAASYLVASAKGVAKGIVAEHVGLAMLTILGSWVLIHTLFTLRYAHIWYGDGGKSSHCGGLDFPEEQHPDYLDFAYFSFIIGMTCQVSDVQITAKGLRRLALVHGLLAFAFNTIILALSINIVSGLISG